jgi:hypothetical protein
MTDNLQDLARAAESSRGAARRGPPPARFGAFVGAATGIMLGLLLGSMAVIYFVFLRPTATGGGGGGGVGEPAAGERVIDVEAADLVHAYRRNEVAADSQYRGRLLDVTGDVESIRRDMLDQPFVMLHTGPGLQGVQCVFPESRAGTISELHPGDHVTIRGRCGGVVIGVVVLRDSVRR